MAKEKSKGKERGKFLSIFIILGVILSVFTLIPTEGINAVYVLGVIVSVLSLIFYRMIWQWKKLGVYLYIAFSLVALIIYFPVYYYSPASTGFSGFEAAYFVVILTVITTSLFIWAVSRKWKYFN